MTDPTPPTTWETIATIAQDMRARAEAERACGDQLLELANAAMAAQPISRSAAPPAPTVMEIIALSGEIEAAEGGNVDLVLAALARWGRPAAPPVAVDDRPWESDPSWLADGKCWYFPPTIKVERSYGATSIRWQFEHPRWMLSSGWVLPASAIPIPTQKPTP